MRSRSLLSGACAAIALMTANAAFAEAPAAPAVVASAPAAAATNAFTYNDMITANRLGDPQVSADGRWLVYSLTTTDVAANKRTGSLWIKDLKSDGAATRLAISDAGANTTRWGSDGKLYFLSSRSGTSQVWRAEADGSAPVQITSLALDVNAYRLSPDASKVAVSLAVFPDCADIACTVDRTKAVADDKSTGQVYDRMFVRHWDTWADGTQNHLFVIPTAGGDPVWITKGFDGDTPSKPFGDEAEFTFTPDGSGIVFSARHAGKSEPWSTNFDLYQVSLTAPGQLTNLTQDNEAWDTGPVFSPDGKTLAYRAMARPGFEADKYSIFLRDVATGSTRQIAANWDRSADTLQWSADGRTLYTTAGDVGQNRIFAIDAAGGTVVPITGEGHVSGFVQTPSGFIFAQDSLTRPTELFAKTFRGREMPHQITDVNPQLDAKAFGEAEQFTFAVWMLLTACALDLYVRGHGARR
ncbi:MAG: family peptidase, partial [Brevundimonas sp.]|nr:family peptidase [Brevundimonas sp.]